MPAPFARTVSDRIVGGVKRRILNLPMMDAWSSHLREKYAERYRSNLQALDPPYSGIVEGLRETGIWAGPSGELCNLGYRPPATDDLFENLAKLNPQASTVRLKASDLETLTPAYLAGLQPLFLTVAEHYIGLPPLYLGVEAKIERPDGAIVGVRKWHFDVEDLRVLKVLVYLTPVGPGDGGLEYVPAAQSQAFRRRMRYRRGFLDEDDVRPPESSVVMGPSGTVVMLDGARLLHRAQVPMNAPRLSVQFSYASRRPRQIFAGARPSVAARRALKGAVTPEQFACVP